MFEQLPLLAGLVLLVKLPSNMAIELIAEKPPIPPTHSRPSGWSPWSRSSSDRSTAPAIVVVLANRMSGRATEFGHAIRTGVDQWARLFAARLVANFLILLGLFAFIVPGIILAVRYSLIDAVVVLEGASVAESRNRAPPWSTVGE